MSDLLTDADAILLDALESIMRSRLSPSHWAQACIPLSLGGLGIRSAQLSGPAARMAALCSWIRVEGADAPLPVGFSDVEATVLRLCDVDDPNCRAWRDRPPSGPLPLAACSQKMWTAKCERLFLPTGNGVNTNNWSTVSERPYTAITPTYWRTKSSQTPL